VITRPLTFPSHSQMFAIMSKSLISLLSLILRTLGGLEEFLDGSLPNWNRSLGPKDSFEWNPDINR